MKHWSEKLDKLNACSEAVEWANWIEDLRAKCERLEHMLYHCYQAGYSAGMANMPSSNMQNDFEICCKVLNEKEDK